MDCFYAKIELKRLEKLGLISLPSIIVKWYPDSCSGMKLTSISRVSAGFKVMD